MENHAVENQVTESYAGDKKPVNLKRLAIHIAVEALVVIAVFFVLLWPFRVGGESMEPRFRDGGVVAASRGAAWIGWINRGHVIICRMEHYNERYTAIKRVIGLPGERVVIENGAVFVDGVELEHTHETPGTIDILLGDGEFFVLGDDRERSYDSRFAGTVARRDIVARVWFGRSF